MEELIEQRLVKDPPEPKSKRKNFERIATGLLCAAGLNLLVNIGFNEHYSNKLKELNIQANSKEGPYADLFGAFREEDLLEYLCSENIPHRLPDYFYRKCSEENMRIQKRINESIIDIESYKDKRIELEEQKSKSLKRAFIYGYFKK